MVDNALEYLRDYQVCNERLAVAQMKERPNWHPPQQGRYKINVDGAVFAAQNAIGVGVLIRDEEGRVIGACWRL